MAEDEASALYGAWESTEAFGNTALDWSQALKDSKVTLTVAFDPSGEYAFQLFAQDAATGERTDVTTTFRHVVAAKGKYSLQGAKGLLLKGLSVCGLSVMCVCVLGSLSAKSNDACLVLMVVLLAIGDTSGIQWTYQREEGDTLRLRLEGAKRFGRCKGVDVIYFKRATGL